MSLVFHRGAPALSCVRRLNVFSRLMPSASASSADSSVFGDLGVAETSVDAGLVLGLRHEPIVPDEVRYVRDDDAKVAR